MTKTEEKGQGTPARKNRLGLTSIILIALGLGIICGVIFHYCIPQSGIRDDVFVNGIFYVIGQGFIRLMQMLVVPLFFAPSFVVLPQLETQKRLAQSALKRCCFICVRQQLLCQLL